MKTQTRIVLAVLLMTFVVFVGQSSAQEMGRYIVHTTGDALNEAARQGVEDHAGLTLKELPTGTGLVVLIPEVALEHMIKIPGVVAVEPDVVLTAVAEVLPWGVDRIDADLAWGTVTGAGVNIAIIDTGIDRDHPDLAVDGGINFVRKGRRVDPDKWDDDNGHGTHCAGIAAALDNDIGVVGVAPAASLYGVKVLDRSGSGYLSDIMDGIYWAADNGMEVINLSLGIDKETLDQYPNDRDALEAAVDYADGVGVVVVAAAGNEGAGEDTVIYPARFASAIAVSASDSGDNLASFSSTGDSVELAAPGVSIYSTYKDGGYATGSGTSMASPHVAGTAALMIANFVYSRETLCSTAEDLGADGWDPYYGHGLVDAAAAVGVSEATGSIAGTVTDADTLEVIADATVTADPGGYSTTTASDGTYTLADLPVGSYTLTASATGYTDESKTDDVLEGETTTVDFALNPVAEPTTGSIEGTVTNVSDGTAIEGATVSVDTGQSATTAADGTYTITDVPTGDRSVTASADGFESQSKTAPVTENLTTEGVDFALNPVTTPAMYVDSIVFTSKVAGPNKFLYTTVKVVDGDGFPLDEVRVEMTLTHESAGPWNFAGNTGNDGTVKFTLGKAPSGDYEALVTNLTGETLADCTLNDDGTIIQ